MRLMCAKEYGGFTVGEYYYFTKVITDKGERYLVTDDECYECTYTIDVLVDYFIK